MSNQTPQNPSPSQPASSTWVSVVLPVVGTVIVAIIAAVLGNIFESPPSHRIVFALVLLVYLVVAVFLARSSFVSDVRDQLVWQAVAMAGFLVAFFLLTGLLDIAAPVAQDDQVVLFDPARSAFSVETIYPVGNSDSGCSFQIDSGQGVFTNVAPNTREICALNFAQKRWYNDLGVIQTRFSAENVDSDEASSVYIELVTYDDQGVGLQLHCGITGSTQGIRGFSSVSTFGAASILMCPPPDTNPETIDDVDPSDERCDRFRRDPLGSLELGVEYSVRLEASQPPASPGNFKCTIWRGTEQFYVHEYFVDPAAANLDFTDLTSREFIRSIEANYAPGSNADYVVGEIRESAIRVSSQ